MQEMNKKVVAQVDRDQPFSKEWRLEEEKMSEKEMLMVAKARWIYHCERNREREYCRYHSTDEQTDQTDENHDEESEMRNEKRADKTTH